MKIQPYSDHFSKTQNHLRNLALTGLFAAMICLTTAYLFHIPLGGNEGYVHIGDGLIYLSAALLPTPYAMLAGAIGGCLADLLTAPVWAPATFIIKMLIVLPLTSKKDTFVNVHNSIGLIASASISFLGYLVAERILFGTWAAILPSLIGSLTQSVASAILYIVAGRSLDRIHFKQTICKF